MRDWRDAAAYAPLLHAGRSGFAWEWLRRDPSYAEAALRALGSRDPQGPARVRETDLSAAQWGLHAFEAPDCDAIAARPVWRRHIFPYVLEAAATDEGDHDDRLDLERLTRLVTLVENPGGTEHLLLSDGSCAVRLDILSGTLRAPANLRYRLAGLRRAEPPLLVLRQLLALSRTGKFSPALHPRERRAGRWILLLRTRDALVAGASQREIAEGIFRLDRAERRWRVQDPSVRSRVQRLVREARRMAGRGYLSLLSGR